MTTWTVPAAWRQAKPKHDWNARGQVARCGVCGLAIWLDRKEKRQPFGCVTIHLAENHRPSRERSHLPPHRREAACGYTPAWNGETTPQRDSQPENWNEPLILDQPQARIRKAMPFVQRSHPRSQPMTIQVNCPDCLHPGLSPKTNRE